MNTQTENVFETLGGILRPEPTKELHDLSGFLQRAIWAHSWTSFIPDKRGAQIVDSYGEQLKQDIETLRSNDINAEKVEQYATRYKNLFSSWISAKSRCASSVITGGSGFNVRKAEKANRSEHRHFELWQEWRERAIKAILRKEKPQKTYQSELERYRAELTAMQLNHEKMKQGNKKIKEALKRGGRI